ncbi:hypothetical protein D3C81_11110 [compost metagenome]
MYLIKNNERLDALKSTYGVEVYATIVEELSKLGLSFEQVVTLDTIKKVVEHYTGREVVIKYTKLEDPIGDIDSEGVLFKDKKSKDLVYFDLYNDIARALPKITVNDKVYYFVWLDVLVLCGNEIVRGNMKHRITVNDFDFLQV